MKRIAWGVTAACLLVAGDAGAGAELIDFPDDYKSTFTYVTTRDQHLGGNTVVDIYANYMAIYGANGADPLANGSVMLMETYRPNWTMTNSRCWTKTARDQGPVPRHRHDGKAQRLGEIYPEELRNGEWEYALFTTNGVARDRPITSCLECHGPLHELDYVYTFFELADIKAGMKE